MDDPRVADSSDSPDSREGKQRLMPDSDAASLDASNDGAQSPNPTVDVGDPRGEFFQVSAQSQSKGDAESTVASEDAVWLHDDDFHRLAAPLYRSQRPGPGLPEAMAWLMGVLGLQLLGATVVSLLIFAGYAATLPQPSQEQLAQSLGDPKTVSDLETRFQVPVLAGSQLIFLVGVIVAAWLRLGGRAADRLSLSPMPLRHGIMLGLMILPMMIISNESYAVADEAWQRIVEQIPALQSFDAMNSMEMIPKLASEASPVLLLFMLALVPAIAEELVFRGVIGRGLVARWGLPMGVLLTSLMFAIVHIHPAHAMGVLPLGIAMHLVYLATRSFWAPVLFHFLNNGAAVLLLGLYRDQYAEAATSTPDVVPVTEQHASLLLLSTAVACAIALGALVWQMRVRYVLPNGEIWTPGYDTAERPPASLGAVRACRTTDWRVAAVAVLALLAFASAFVQASLEP